MANTISLTVMGGAAAPYNSSGPFGNEFNTTLGGVPNGISESMDFEVVNIVRTRSYIQPASGTTYPAVNSVVIYKSVNTNNGYAKLIKMYVNETRTAIRTASNA